MAVSDLLDIAVATYADRTAMGSRGSGVTYEQLARQAGGAATMMAAAGGRHVAFVGVNSAGLVHSLFGSAVAGLPFTPLNYRLSDSDLFALLERLDEPLVIADEAMLPRLTGNGLSSRLLSTERLVAGAAAAEALPPQPQRPDDTAVLLFTSGTTSAPKAVPLRHGNLTSYVLQTIDLLSASEDECTLVSVPPYHIAGVASILTNVYAGRRICHLPNFAPDRWLEIVRAERVTSAMLVPTMLARIVEYLGDSPPGTPSLKSLAYGGGRVSPVTLERALKSFPDTGFVNAYGLTETSSTVALLGPEDHRAAIASEEPSVRARLSSVGRPVPGVEIVVRGPDGSVLPAGEVGGVYVRGPQVSGEYVGQGSALDADGWFPTRDRGKFDKAGYLFIEGRNDDTIIRGGENIAPAEIEDVLVQHALVRDAAVVGIPDEEWGEQIAAVVVGVPGVLVDTGELQAFVRERLRSSKTPQSIEVWAELPYSPTGKLLRREIISKIVAQGSA